VEVNKFFWKTLPTKQTNISKAFLSFVIILGGLLAEGSLWKLYRKGFNNFYAGTHFVSQSKYEYLVTMFHNMVNQL